MRVQPRRGMAVVVTVLVALVSGLVVSVPAWSDEGMGLSGRVLAPDGSTLYVEVSLELERYDAGSDTWQTEDQQTATPDNGGAYRFGLAEPGQYRVLVYSQGEFEVAISDPHTVADGQSIADVDLRLVLARSISGTVKELGGATLTADATVELRRSSGDGGWDEEGIYMLVAGGTGYYAFGGLSAGEYQLSVYSDGVYAVAESAVVELGATGSVTGVDIELVPPTGSISGTVTVPAEPGNAQVGEVELLDHSGARRGRVAPQFEGAADTSGEYSFTGLEAGTYIVAFNRGPGPTLLAAQYFDAVTGDLPWTSATEVELAVGADRVGVDATLQIGGSISGTLLPAGDASATDCELKAVALASDAPLRLADIEPDGSFVIGGLSAGEYTLDVSAGTCGSDVDVTLRRLSVDLGQSVALPTDLDVDAPDLGGEGSQIEALTRPGISGTTKVGVTLTAVPGEWSVSGVTNEYVWWADDRQVGTGPTYVLRPSDLGAMVRVVATGSKVGDLSGSSRSDEAGPVSFGAFAALSRPKISGAALVGKTLSVSRGSWSAPSPSLTYQWLRNGRAISAATRSAYLLTAADRGARISVRVLASSSGYAAVQVDSAATVPVRQATRIAMKVSAGKRKATIAVAVKASGLSSSRLTGKVTVSLNGRIVANGRVTKGKVKLKIAKQARGSRRYVVRYHGNSVAAPVARTVRIRIR